MQPAGKKEQFLQFWTCLFLGIVMEDYGIGAPRERPIGNAVVLVITAGVAGVLYLIRRRRSFEAA